MTTSSKPTIPIIASRQTFAARDGTELAYCTWECEGGEARAIFLILHGIGFHSEPYGALAQGIDSPGTLFAGLDFRGHGLSGGKRGDLPGLGLMLSDIGDWVSHMRSIHPSAKLILTAESMAGPYATLYASRNPRLFDGLVLIAPAMIPARQQVFHLITIKEIVRSLCRPSSPGILLSSARAGYKPVNGVKPLSLRVDDALALQTVEPKYMLRLFYAMTQLFMKRSVTIDAPVLIVHGYDDNIVSPMGSRMLFRKIRSPHKYLEFLRDARHTLIWDSTRDETCAIIEQWLAPLLDTQR